MRFERFMVVELVMTRGLIAGKRESVADRLDKKRNKYNISLGSHVGGKDCDSAQLLQGYPGKLIAFTDCLAQGG